MLARRAAGGYGAVMDLLPCLEHEPGVPARGTVIWLHGLGADGYDFAPLVPHFDLDGVRFVFPHAPRRPVTINQGYVMPAWYDLRSLSRGPDREDPDDIRASAARIEALIAREVTRGVPEHKVVLAGFSQGAAMALHVGLRRDRPLAGVIALSGYLVLDESLEAEVGDAARATPVHLEHGTNDDVVDVAAGRHARDRLRSLGLAVEWHEWPMAHEVCGEEIREVRRFLAGRLG